MVGAYLDYNATAPARPESAAAAAAAAAIGGNPSSVHRYGRLARGVIDRARDQVAALVGADAEDVVFTSGGTEANALAIHSLVACGTGRLLVSAVEHDSVLAAARNAGVGHELIPVGRDGVIDLGALDALLGEGACGVAVMLANNETGAMQPVAEAARLAHSRGAHFHCDAVQGPGRIAVDFAALGADTLALSAHKIGGLHGAGALVARDVGGLAPLQRGGGQERGLRAGTENVPGIAAFGAAAAESSGETSTAARIEALRDDLERRVRAAAPGVRVFADGVRRLANTSCFALAGLAAETQVIALDLAGVAVSAGAACSSGKVSPSHVLRAMGATEAEATAAIRVSLGWASTAADVDRFVAAWSEFVARNIAGGGAPRAARAAH